VIRQPSPSSQGVQLAALIAAAVVAVLSSGSVDWNLPLALALAACAIISDLTAANTATAKLKVSGSFLALVLAMVLLGGPPAALIGVITIAVGWLRWREERHYLLQNLVAYAWFPLIGGLAFTEARDALALGRTDLGFDGLVFATFVLALALNFLLTAGYQCYLERVSLVAKARAALVPLLPSELFTALIAVFVVYLYLRVGLAAIALLAVVLAGFQHLLGQLLLSQRRSTQLATLQLGMMTALLRTLDLRDRMTARHSAAVARYAREIAREVGLSEREQELVHTAGLLHDLGKFVFPDRILKADAPLTEADWEIVRTHPERGAEVVSQVEGYGPIAEIILSHHERIDGRGYPQGLRGEEIPMLARVLSVADVYDVMTARDSYRQPVSSLEAIQELRRSAGTQLEPRYVEVLVAVLAGRDLRFRHGDDADFDAELALERRASDYATGAAGTTPPPVARSA
jgi:putative nucleotidyltransferase with HDIG domain